VSTKPTSSHPAASLNPVSQRPSVNCQAGNAWAPFFWRYIPRPPQGFAGVSRGDTVGE